MVKNGEWLDFGSSITPVWTAHLIAVVECFYFQCEPNSLCVYRMYLWVSGIMMSESVLVQTVVQL